MKKNSAYSFVKIGAIYTFSDIIVKGIVFLTTPFFTRIMSKNEYGEFSNILAWASIICIISTWGLYSSISRAKYDFDDEMNKYMSSITILGNIITLLCWGVIELKIDFFEDILSINRQHIRIILLYSLFYPAVQTLLVKSRMYAEYVKVIIVSWLTLLASTGVSLILVYNMSNKLDGRVYGNYLSVTVINFLIWLYILLKGKSFSPRYCVYACQLSVPLIFHELAGILLNSSDRIIVNKICGAEDAALYSLAYTVAMIVTVILSALNQAWIPWFYDNLESENYDHIKLVAPKYNVFFTIGCIMIMLFGPEFIRIFGGYEYASAVYVIPPVCFAVELQFVYTLYVNIEFYLKKTIYISIATAMATVINIALNYALIPYFGYVVAAYTTVVGFFFMFVFHYFICKKFMGNVFEIRKILGNISVCIIAMLINLYLYSHTVLRYIIISCILIALVCFLYRNIEVIKSNLFRKNKKG